ncbi:fatty acid hydroxylase domain-containing protein 2 [Procambarus clarkii]|uniref:fatty acid hydroxylase domain-containing protein 2 n=1 Tax=Procambarus clarkii TaxID=6728 RepID=UPI001E675A57|nr:fatty acid hydroxylase domain-containing protein 2-like [Procambarus clarkii]
MTGNQEDGRRADSPSTFSFSKVLLLLTVVCTSLTLLTLGNTVDYYVLVLKVWEAAGRFWQRQWDWVLLICGHQPFNLIVYGTTVLGYSVYWLAGSLYTIIDTTGRPACLRRYKVQPNTNQPPPLRLLLKCILLVNVNLVGTTIPFMIVSYHALLLRGSDLITAQLPDLFCVLRHLAVCILMEEIGFYYSHRLFHHRLLYKHFHKIHHEWQSPIAITAACAHPLEHLLCNLVPILLGPLLLGVHPATLWLWVVVATLGTLVHHSGYHLPFLLSPQFHDFHHLKFNECYGLLGVLDFLHCTDRNFRNSSSYRRHRTLLSLLPAHLAFPDHSKDTKRN